jgi:hypothetical protein
MGAYWERIQGGFVAQQSVPVVRLRASILISLVALLLLLGYIGSTRSTTLGSLLGFVPTSGGSGENDESARSGIGDGDRVVAAQETAMSFGPVESELFLEDTSPSLYDMFTDMYGEAPKAKNVLKKLCHCQVLKAHLNISICHNLKSRVESSPQYDAQKSNKLKSPNRN